jgi:glycerol-3-phosphate O-acyltransferase
MTPFDGLTRAWRWSVRKILGLWVKFTIKPDDAAAVIASRPRPVCYVLERESHTDLAMLYSACAELRLPRPLRRFELTRRARFWTRRGHLRAPRYLVQLVAAADANPEFDVDLVPVAIFWGRAPLKEVSLWRLLFSEDWVLMGRFRKLLNIIFNGRNTVVHFG